MWWRRDPPVAGDPRADRLAARYGAAPAAGGVATHLIGHAALADQVLRATGAVRLAPAGTPVPDRADILYALVLASEALVRVLATRRDLDVEARSASMADISTVSAAMDHVLTAQTNLEAIQAGLIAAAVKQGIPRADLAATGVSDDLLARWYHIWTRD